MLRRRSPDQTSAPIEDDVAAILLGAWAAKPPEGEGDGFTDGLIDLFSHDQSYLGELWEAHATYLRALAARWQWEPRFRGCYFAEAISRGLLK